MPWKFVCKLWFHEVLQTTIFIKPNVADKLPCIKYIYIYKYIHTYVYICIHI